MGLAVKKDILETAKTLVLSRQREQEGEGLAAQLLKKINLLEKNNTENTKKINQNILSILSKLEQIIEKLK